MASAAMRFGHSLIIGVFTLVKDNGISDRSNNLTELVFDSDIIYRDGKLLSGLHKWPIFEVNIP